MHIISSYSVKRIYLEMGLFHEITGTGLQELISTVSLKHEMEFIAINSGVDLFLSLASYRRNLFRPRKLLAIYRWKKGITKLLFNKKWLIPKISNSNFTIFSKEVEQISIDEINNVSQKLFQLVSVRECFLQIPTKNYRFLILAFGLEFDEQYAKNLSTQVRNINKNLDAKLPYIIKPHPNIKFN